LQGSLLVTGNSNLTGTLNASGATTLNSSLHTSGDTTLNGSLYVTGSVNYSGITRGWFLEGTGTDTDFKYYPIICSQAKTNSTLQNSNNIKNVLLLADTKLLLYDSTTTPYDGSVTTITNSSLTTALCTSLGTTSAVTIYSYKLYNNTANTEIIITGIS
jgi:hypothetical protein